MQRPDNPFFSNMSCCSFRDDFKKQQQIQSMKKQQQEGTDRVCRGVMSSHGKVAYTSVGASEVPVQAATADPFPSHQYKSLQNPPEADNMSKCSSQSRHSHATVEWERTRAAGSAAVDVTNLFINPRRPSAINIWQGAHGSIYAHGPREDKGTFNDYEGVYQDNKLDLDGYYREIEAPTPLASAATSAAVSAAPSVAGDRNYQSTAGMHDKFGPSLHSSFHSEAPTVSRNDGVNGFFTLFTH